MANVSFKGAVGKVHGLHLPQDQGGKSRFSFSVAENHSRFDKQQNRWIDTGVTWFNVTVFGKDAEHVADVIKEGAKQIVTVQGRQSTRTYTTKEGEERTSLDVVADAVGLVHIMRQQGTPTTQPQQSTPQQWGQAPAQPDPWSGGQQSAWPSEPGGPAPF